jgi:ABC-2 type transport system ATP-binding protein
MARETVWSLLAAWRKNEGGTAIVCSHILAEMEEEATDYAIIDRGQLLKSGRVADLAGESATFKVDSAASLEQIRAALAAAGINANIAPAASNLANVYRETVGA